MRERLIELWLDSAKETSFQYPFCAALVMQGHTVLHLTRHCGMELGKDILTRDSKGNICAFQLKNAKGALVPLEWWRREIETQKFELCDNAIIHPAVPFGTPHIPHVVLNGDLNEEVSAAVLTFNALRKPKKSHLRVVTRGEMLAAFKKLGTSLWPESDSLDYRPILEIFLSTGAEMFPKAKLARVLESLGLKKGDKLSANDGERLITSALMLTSLVVERFQTQKNYYAEFEAWIVCLANILRLAEKTKMPVSRFQQQRTIVTEAALGALERFCDEVQLNEGLSQGSPFTDHQLRGSRLTIVSGALSLFGLWRKWREEPEGERDAFIRRFTLGKFINMEIAGECAAPAFLALALYRGIASAGMEKEHILARYLNVVLASNSGRSSRGLPCPYYGYDEAFMLRAGLDEDAKRDTFTGVSYTAEPFFNLMVRANMKQYCRAVWPPYTKVANERFVPKSINDVYYWRNRTGLVETRHIPRRGDWGILRQQVKDIQPPHWPKLLLQDPGAALAFCIVYPHRLDSEVARWLDAVAV